MPEARRKKTETRSKEKIRETRRKYEKQGEKTTGSMDEKDNRRRKSAQKDHLRQQKRPVARSTLIHLAKPRIEDRDTREKRGS